METTKCKPRFYKYKLSERINTLLLQDGFQATKKKINLAKNYKLYNPQNAKAYEHIQNSNSNLTNSEANKLYITYLNC